MTPRTPRIPRLRADVLAALCRQDWCERRLLPLVLAFAAGVVLGLVADDRRAADELHAAQARTAQAQRRQAAAEHLAAQYAATCGPRLSWPIGSTPEIIPAAQGGARP